jgi:hypothetical protein
MGRSCEGLAALNRLTVAAAEPGAVTDDRAS